MRSATCGQPGETCPIPKRSSVSLTCKSGLLRFSPNAKRSLNPGPISRDFVNGELQVTIYHSQLTIYNSLFRILTRLLVRSHRFTQISTDIFLKSHKIDEYRTAVHFYAKNAMRGACTESPRERRNTAGAYLVQAPACHCLPNHRRRDLNYASIV